MVLVSFFIGFGVFCAVAAIANLLSGQSGSLVGSALGSEFSAKRLDRKRPGPTRKISRIDGNELSKLMCSDPDLAVFRLVDEQSRGHRSTWLPGEHEITHSQLEEAVPWIAPRNKIVIYRPGGIDPAEKRRLAAILKGHQAFLFSGFGLPTRPEGFDRMAHEFVTEPSSLSHGH